ncbi:MAG TPA: MMPL family transporter [Methanocorpusculum sp.]|nr:MMPL family transporter [Methanocorpusculum sp.]
MKFDYPKFIVKHRKAVIVIFLIIAVLCAILFTQVGINYKVVDYLPQDYSSSKSLDILKEQYPGGIPNARVMVYNVTIPEALIIKENLKTVDGVNEVLWLDNVVSTDIPLEYIGDDAVKSFYRNNTALFTLTLDEDKSTAAVHTIGQYVGDQAKMSGMEVSIAYSSETINTDLVKILAVAVPIVLLILILTTTSWIEPLLFLFVIGIAIVINMGTNIIYGEISFVTQGIAALLQLAIAIDYAIFLLHRFNECTKEGMNAEDAMVAAMKRASKSIVASAITGAVGFASLLVMQFLIGPDIGRVMIKGILISLVCVFTILPALTVCCHKLLEKTHHRSFIPDLHKLARVNIKLAIPCAIIILLLLIPCVPAVLHSHYIYADVLDGPDTQVGKNKVAIQEVFGDFSSMVLMVPNGNFSSERAVQDELKAIPVVTAVVSYSGTVGTEIPQEYVPNATREKIISPAGVTRFVLTLNTTIESDAAFASVETIRAIGEHYYPGQWALAGEIANSYDMRDCVKHDDIMVNIVSIGGIFLVLLFIFRSLITPAILLLAIESAIWVTCGMAYFMGQDLYYFARMIIFALLLAATVDYGILYADRYFEFRKRMKKKRAVEEAIAAAGVSIITSAAILFVCGLALYLLSSNVLLSALGELLTRGSILALLGVLFIIPALFLLLDKPIEKLTLKAKFYPQDAPEDEMPLPGTLPGKT